MPSSRLIGVGAFVIGGVLLFAAGLFLIGDRRGLFQDRFEVYAEFNTLGGLERGATVRVAGLDAGEVTAIHVPSGPRGKFRVRIRIREDLHGVVRSDSVASIQNEGLLGNKFVQVEGGTEETPPAPDGSTIRSRDPFDIADLLNQMRETLVLVNSTVDMLKVEVQHAIQTVSDTADEARILVVAARDQIEAIGRDGRRIAENMRVVMDNVRSGRGTVGRLLGDDVLYEDARRIAREVERVVANLRDVAAQARQAVTDFNDKMTGKDAPAQGLAADLRQTIVHARDAMADLAENAEALKRNFFFRGFFNRRGYFDLDDISPDAYRAGALETADRRALRIWLDAAYLFQTDENGVERLTEEGRSRIDSAMSELLEYPPGSPLVVEGYATEPTGDARYLSARRRAAVVRDYVIGKFALDANRVAIMPLGAEAPGSPTGQTWRGVALALFVSR
ncbi:MAG TPA: MlaD family protein [Vicinamibacterales bacterium]|nr:MlaD family protein [Vicinamibacterales bacterium]